MKKEKASTAQRKARSAPPSGSPWDRFDAAIKVVVRNLGGARQFLIACGYIPSEWVRGYAPGYYVSPHNPNIMWKGKDAISDHFTRFRWHDRVEAAERQYKANNPMTPNRKQSNNGQISVGKRKRILGGNILITANTSIGKTTLAHRIKAGIQASEPGHRVEVVNDAPSHCTKQGIQLLQDSHDTLIFVCHSASDVRKLRRWGVTWRVVIPMRPSQ